MEILFGMQVCAGDTTQRLQQLPPHQPTQSKHNQVVFVGCCDTFAGFALGAKAVQL